MPEHSFLTISSCFLIADFVSLIVCSNQIIIGAKSGGEITHAVLNGSIVSKPAGWDAFHGLVLAKEKLSSEEIQRQMKELGVEMEIVPLI